MAQPAPDSGSSRDLLQAPRPSRGEVLRAIGLLVIVRLVAAAMQALRLARWLQRQLPARAARSAEHRVPR